MVALICTDLNGAVNIFVYDTYDDADKVGMSGTCVSHVVQRVIDCRS